MQLTHTPFVINRSATSPIACHALPQTIAHSWQRCLQYGLDPLGDPIDAVLTEYELAEAFDASSLLMSIARPELELLSAQIAGTKSMAAFANAEGVILDSIPDEAFGKSELAAGIRPGSVWREEFRGTNALGLALHRGQTSMVTAGEHFFAEHSGLACVSAPVFASDGRIIGMLDVSSESAARQDLAGVLVSLTATNIQHRLFFETHQADLIVQFHPRHDYLVTQSTGLIAFDGEGCVRGANRLAGEILEGQRPRMGQHYSDIFDGAFEPIIDTLRKGNIAEIADHKRSDFFARLAQNETLPSRGSSLVKADPENQLIFDDDLVREGMRMMRSMLALNQPVCIMGEMGVGKSTVASHLISQDPVYTIDCRKLLTDALDDNVFSFASGESLEKGGTLLLDHVSVFERTCPIKLNFVLEELIRGEFAQRWKIIATSLPTVQSKLGPVRFHSAKLPNLADRTDFEKLVKAMLAKLSSQHQISSKGFETLKKLTMVEHFWDLLYHLQVLVATCPKGVIRGRHIEQIFPGSEHYEDVCPRCSGIAIREKRCLEIRKMYRGCQRNIALTARRLGVSRNTVYLHLKD